MTALGIGSAAYVISEAADLEKFEAFFPGTEQKVTLTRKQWEAVRAIIDDLEDTIADLEEEGRAEPLDEADRWLRAREDLLRLGSRPELVMEEHDAALDLIAALRS